MTIWANGVPFEFTPAVATAAGVWRCDAVDGLGFAAANEVDRQAAQARAKPGEVVVGRLEPKDRYIGTDADWYDDDEGEP